MLGSVCDLMSFVFRIKAVERALDALKAMAGLDMLGLARRRRVRHKFDMLWEMLINALMRELYYKLNNNLMSNLIHSNSKNNLLVSFKLVL